MVKKVRKSEKNMPLLISTKFCHEISLRNVEGTRGFDHKYTGSKVFAMKSDSAHQSWIHMGTQQKLWSIGGGQMKVEPFVVPNHMCNCEKFGDFFDAELPRKFLAFGSSDFKFKCLQADAQS